MQKLAITPPEHSSLKILILFYLFVFITHGKQVERAGQGLRNRNQPPPILQI
jgi:hypothetical protein